MATFVVAHGAWAAGWAWKKMRPLLTALGHQLWTPTYTGLGERVHLATPQIDLETHIADVRGLLQFEDLRNIILIGHSYGGMVATAVADRESERIAHLVYVDAFVPRHGQSLLDLRPVQEKAGLDAGAKRSGDGWRVPPSPVPPDTSPADVAWITPRRVMHPLKTFEQPVSLTGAGEVLPKTYIYCTRIGPTDVFRPFAERAQTEAGWRYLEMDASHSPQITAPNALARLLDDIAAEEG